MQNSYQLLEVWSRQHLHWQGAYGGLIQWIVLNLLTLSIKIDRPSLAFVERCFPSSRELWDMELWPSPCRDWFLVLSSLLLLGFLPRWIATWVWIRKFTRWMTSESIKSCLKLGLKIRPRLLPMVCGWASASLRLRLCWCGNDLTNRKGFVIWECLARHQADFNLWHPPVWSIWREYEYSRVTEYSIIIILVYSFLKCTLSSHVKLSVSKVTNPSGSVHRDAEPSSPCLGSQPGQSIRGLELLSRRWSRGVFHESHVSDGFLNRQVMPHIQQAATAAPWCKGLERNHINRSSRQWWQWWKQGTDSQTASLASRA